MNETHMDSDIRQSPEIGDLAKALAVAQADYPEIKKEKEADAGSYTYKYADLGDVLTAVREVLGKNGLSIIQPTIIEGGTIFLRSRLMHESGQWIESDFPVATYSGAKHQQVGAALTYARRYAACSLLGVAAEEGVDADADIGKGARKEPRKQTRREPPAVVQGGDDQRPLPPVVGEPQKELEAAEREAPQERLESPQNGDPAWWPFVSNACDLMDKSQDIDAVQAFWTQNGKHISALPDEALKMLTDAKDAAKERLGGGRA